MIKTSLVKYKSDAVVTWERKLHILFAPFFGNYLSTSEERWFSVDILISHLINGEPKQIDFYNKEDRFGWLKTSLEVYLDQYIFSESEITKLGLSAQFIKSFYIDFSSLPTDIAVRWAKFLDKISYEDKSTPQYDHWLLALIHHMIAMDKADWENPEGAKQNIPKPPFSFILDMLHEYGISVAERLKGFMLPQSRWGIGKRFDKYDFENQSKLRTFFFQSAGFAEAVKENSEQLRPAMAATKSPWLQMHQLKLLEGMSVDILEEWVKEIALFAVSKNFMVKTFANELLQKVSTTKVIEAVRVIAINGKPEQRIGAFEFLWQYANEIDNTVLQEEIVELVENDRASSVQNLLPTLIQTKSNINIQQPQEVCPFIQWKVELTPTLSDLINSLITEYADKIEDKNKLSDQALKDLCEYLTSPDPLPKKTNDYLLSQENAYDYLFLPEKWYDKLINLPDISPVHLIKILYFCRLLITVENDGLKLNSDAQKIFNKMHQRTGKPTLLELQELLSPFDIKPETLLALYCSYAPNLFDYDYHEEKVEEWQDDAILPFICKNQEIVGRYLQNSRSIVIGDDYSIVGRQRLFGLLQRAQNLPPLILDALFNIALSDSKSESKIARDIWDKIPQKETRIISALQDSKATVRAAAVSWLLQLKCKESIPTLEKVVAKEKNDLTKAALLEALEKFGQPISKYLNQENLLKQAIKGLTKGLPKELKWFPWENIPLLHWENTLEPVPQEIIQWLLVQACKLKNPEPAPLLRLYCKLIEPNDRERFGQFVLESWIDNDVPPDYDFYDYVEVNEAYSQREYVRVLDSKGILAIPAICASAPAVILAHNYIKKYYGNRPGQGQALVRMMAWIDHPLAMQIVLSLSIHFRTWIIQKEAIAQVELLAVRKGWTTDELADRTISTSGFDKNAILTLSYGSRCFTAHFTPNFEIKLYNEQGKNISNLPKPNQTDDEELAAESRKNLSAAKKEIKNTIKIQKQRLYEAFCVQRKWRFDDWQLYLNSHPIMKQLTQKLVWMYEDTEKGPISFRPIEDGTLIDVDNNKIPVPADALIHLAHDLLLPKEQVNNWLEYLNNNQQELLFEQLGRPIYELPDNMKEATKIDDFYGYIIEGLVLANEIEKRGYTSGEVHDGPSFYEYLKRFQSLGIRAMISFSGNYLMRRDLQSEALLRAMLEGVKEVITGSSNNIQEEDIQDDLVALHSLSFVKAQNTQKYSKKGLPLGSIPKVLLSECYNDLRALALAGSGFDPDWERKVWR